MFVVGILYLWKGTTNAKAVGAKSNSNIIIANSGRLFRVVGSIIVRL